MVLETISDAIEIPHFSPWSNHPESQPLGQNDEPIRGKRPRVALACQRCKTRKQKCDGSHPCSKCKSSSLNCEYVIPQKPMPFGKNQYIKSLERRVAELETILATHGLEEPSNDHWKATSPSVSTSVQTDAARSMDQTGPSPESAADDSEEAVLEWHDGGDSVVSVLRSLSLDVNGSGYMGASSQISLGRLFNFLDSGRRHCDEGGLHSSRRRRATTLPSSTRDVQEPIDFTDVSSNIADRLLAGYMKHIATRVPVAHSVWIREVHNRRHSLTDIFEITMLHLVYATSGRFIQTTGEVGDFHAKQHYTSATQALDTILEFNDSRTIKVLMLMAMYCLRDPVGPGAWTCSRTALLIAIDHGLHRQTKALSRLTLENELRKRLFWACYAFDRQISIPMGRPFGISDRDIDLELPLDINEDITEDQLNSISLSVEGPTKSTSLTSFILITRLRKIESDIQQTIYRVDKTMAVEDSVIDEFLLRLEQWKALIPQDTRRFKDVGDVPFDGYDFYVNPS